MLYVFFERDIEIYLGNGDYIEFSWVLDEEVSSEIRYVRFDRFPCWHRDFENKSSRSLLTPEELEEE